VFTHEKVIFSKNKQAQGVFMSFNDETIQAVWNKGKVVSNNPDRWRKDTCDAWINRGDYGNRDSEWGWEIHHVDSEKGDDLDNLIPLHWKNNVATGDGALQCPVTASGNRNIGI